MKEHGLGLASASRPKTPSEAHNVPALTPLSCLDSALKPQCRPQPLPSPSLPSTSSTLTSSSTPRTNVFARAYIGSFHHSVLVRHASAGRRVHGTVYTVPTRGETIASGFSPPTPPPTRVGPPGYVAWSLLRLCGFCKSPLPADFPYPVRRHQPIAKWLPIVFAGGPWRWVSVSDTVRKV